MMESNLDRWDFNDYVTPWRRALPVLHTIELNSSCHVMMLSEDHVVADIIEVCKFLYEAIYIGQILNEVN